MTCNKSYRKNKHAKRNFEELNDIFLQICFDKSEMSKFIKKTLDFITNFTFIVIQYTKF